MAISPYIKKLREKIGNDLLLLPSVSAIILNAQGHVLLQRSSDDGKWYTVGGAIDPHEQPADAVVREVEEETGLKVRPIRITSVETSPVITYPNGHQAQYVGTTFLCEIIGGKLCCNDDESLEVKFFPLDQLPELRPDQLWRLRYATTGKENASFKEPKG